jgi:aminoglycoside 3-N-acetyltransferase
MDAPAKTLPLTRYHIEYGLRQLGLSRGDMVEVHGALSKLGWVEGGAEAVIDALMNVVGEEGALIMSAYPVSKLIPLTEEEKARGLFAKVQLFGLDYDGPTGMGAIADEFRHRPGVILGPGFHRVCAWGHDAALHSQGYQYLVDAGGWVLLIGVGITSCSSMHTAEPKVKWPQEILESFRLPEDILRDYPEKEWFVQYNNPGQPVPDDPWEKVHIEAERRGLIRHGRIGTAECMFFKAKAVVDIYEVRLRNDPFELFGVSK